MSSRATAAVWAWYEHGGGMRLLALALADSANDDGTSIYPSVETMARMTKQSVRNVQRQLTVMLADGWLVLVRKSTGRRGDSTEYRINADWLAGRDFVRPAAAPDRATKLKIKGAGGATDVASSLGVFATATTGDKLSPVQTVDKSIKNTLARVTNSALTGDTQGLTGDTTVSPNPKITLNTNNPPTPQGGESDFEKFWNRYPKKISHGKARKVFEALAPDADLLAQMLASIAAWSTSDEWRRDAGRWAPKPDRWLREEGWLDVPGQSSPALLAAAGVVATVPSTPGQCEALKKLAAEAPTVRAPTAAERAALDGLRRRVGSSQSSQSSQSKKGV